MNRAKESPTLRRELSHRCRAYFREYGTSMHRTEVRQISHIVELISDYRETGCLKFKYNPILVSISYTKTYTKLNLVTCNIPKPCFDRRFPVARKYSIAFVIDVSRLKASAIFTFCPSTNGFLLSIIKVTDFIVIR
jgi:2-oxoglutarate dehydrogenase complex dehydrogenase (E1) component-like enzyme